MVETARSPASSERLVGGVLDAISEQAAVVDTEGLVVHANLAWRQTPAGHRAIVERGDPGTDLLAALRAQKTPASRTAAEGIVAVLRGSLPTFQTDYDAGERAYSVQVDPMPGGGVVVRHVDITFRKHLQRQLAHRATHDPLTGLPNRMVMAERLGQALIRAARTATPIGLLFCDVDRFKEINDTQGHAVGDQVLTAIGRRLHNTVRQSDLVARFGGDEFVILLEDATGIEQVARDLQTAATSPIVVDGRPLHFGVSLGIVVHAGTETPEPAIVDSLLADADAAMYAAKLSGRGSVRVFEPSRRSALRDPKLIAPALRLAADNDEIRMMVQPIVALDSGRVASYEALVRWELPEVGLLSPADFLQTAEETGAIVEIGRSILRQSLEFARAVPQQSVSVNVSWVELSHPDYAQGVIDALHQAGVTPDRLALEVNIPALVEPDALEGLRRLRRAGVGVTLDAFGRQPVELCVLPDLGASAVKIDRKLAAFTAHPGPRARMVRVLVEMVRGLGLTGIAEGIESREQASAAHALGLEFGQGFYFGKPMETHEALATRG